jgi:hypothetical protein
LLCLPELDETARDSTRRRLRQAIQLFRKIQEDFEGVAC